jgi:hypothetical protein
MTAAISSIRVCPTSRIRPGLKKVFKIFPVEVIDLQPTDFFQPSKTTQNRL